MTKLTPFGVALRKLRVEKGLRLFDVAEKIGKSSSILSAIETGRKPIPDMFVLELSRGLDLTKQEIAELTKAKARTNSFVSVKHLPAEQREMVAAFARRMDEIPSEILDEMRKSLLKSMDDEIPFRRKRRGILVPAMSKAKIETLASKVRTIFCDNSVFSIPIIHIIEFHLEKVFPEFDFQIWERDIMGGDEGRVVPHTNKLILREDVYSDACRGEARARFTACHELGHYLMHHEVSFSRTSSDTDPVYCDAEWQADTFAGFLMLSREHARSFKSPEEAARKCEMSLHAAKVTLAKYSK